MPSTFVYVTFIRTTPEALWDALRLPEFTRRYWVGTVQNSTWEPGATWNIQFPDGRIADTGCIVEYDKPNRTVLRWRHEVFPELRGEGDSLCTFELQSAGGLVKLTITHEMEVPDSKLIKAVGRGWPMILSGLKSLLETGEPLTGIEAFHERPS